MNITKHNYEVVAAVILDSGEVLATQRGRAAYSYTSYKWEFPGGKVEVGETPEEALRREIKEELDMDVIVGRHLVTVEHEYSDFVIRMAAYVCTPINGRALTLKEHHACLWLRPEDFEYLVWAVADDDIVSAVKDMLEG